MTKGDQNWFQRHTVAVVVGAVILVFLVIGMVGGALDPNDDEASGNSGRALAGSSPDQDDPPSLEDQFIAIVENSSDAADEADNEIGVVQARKERASAMCGLLPSSLKVTDWSGEIEDVSTELGGDKGVLSIKLTDDIAVQTWNNALSDLTDRTLIDTGSSLYESLADLGKGDAVTFSGAFVDAGDDCVQEQSLLDENGMATPDFSFKFSSISTN